MDLTCAYDTDPPDPDAVDGWVFTASVTLNLDTGTETFTTGWTTTVSRDDATAEAEDPGYFSPPEPLFHRAFRTAQRRLASDWATTVGGML